MSTVPLQQYVNDKVASGEFASREDFFLETARIYRDLEQRHAGLRDLIAERIREAERGDVAPLDIAEIQQELVRELDGRGLAK
jgi:Arc/MetJ-type ribon-helix-helix transcriptional regulator